MSQTEIKIPVPYGHLSAKTWGSSGPNKINVLAVHGWQDNAGTFDKLIPLLTNRQHMYIVAIDLPGHGLSSHLPVGACYTEMTWAIEMKRTCDFLKWDKITMMSHSMGANASLIFAVLYPDLVERLITFDTIKPELCPLASAPMKMAEEINRFFKLEQQDMISKPIEHSFDYNMAIQVLKVAHQPIGILTNEAAAALLKRATRTVRIGGSVKYIFTRDKRLNAIIHRKVDLESLKSFLSGIRCEMLVINGKTGLWIDKDYQKEFLELYKDKCRRFEYVEVDGDHYVHLTRPHLVNDHINKFLEPAICDVRTSD